jgi:hypothetical protein
MQDTFKNHMIQNYELDELKDIARNGCVNGSAGTMIYYSQTIALYGQYTEELHTIVSDWCDQTGEAPEYLTKALKEGFTSFANAVVWFCAEVIADELINQEETV